MNISGIVCSELSRIEREHAVRVLYACESGSRAWGFASEDSDYDVRFIYVHSADWYLSIDQGRDVIDEMLPRDLDVSGWELRKALSLLRKSNPPLYEWLRSPIVYAKDEEFFSGLLKVSDHYYSPERCFRHYLHMAYGNFRDYLQGEEVWLKKYLYVLRPILACKWIERGLGPVPMEFDVVARAVVEEPQTLGALLELVEKKRKADELGKGPKIPEISQFIEAELARLDSIKPASEPEPSADALNLFFRQVLSRFP